MKTVKRLSILILVIILMIVIRTKYVFLGNEIYRSDVKEVHGMFLQNKRYKISELNRCSEIEYLSVWNADNDNLSEIRDFQYLRTWDIFHADISDAGIDKINMLPNLNEVLLVDADMDLEKINSSSIEILDFCGCNITNIQYLANCSSLTDLILLRTTMDDKIIVTEDKQYLLKDSSEFSELDHIETLRIYYTKIEDISGFTEMDSLRTFTISKGAVSEEDRKFLEDKGITVIEAEVDD